MARENQKILNIRLRKEKKEKTLLQGSSHRSRKGDAPSLQYTATHGKERALPTSLLLAITLEAPCTPTFTCDYDCP
jgi:hypothetical protein